MINRKFQIFLFLSVCIIWGTTWMAMKIAVLTVPPILATGLRFLIASPVLFFLAYIYKQPILFPKGMGKWVIILSLAYFAIPFTLMIYGEKYISSGLGAIIFANMPIFVMLSSLLFLNMKLSKHQVFGLLLGIVSVSAILFRELNITGASYFIGIGSLILAVIIQAVIYVLVQKHCNQISVITYNTLPCLLASIFLIIVSLCFEHIEVSNFSESSVYAIIYLGIVASVGGIMAYFKLNSISTPFLASNCFLIFPVVALLIGAYVNHTTISGISVLLLIPLFIGVLLTKIEKEQITHFMLRLKNKLKTNVNA